MTSIRLTKAPGVHRTLLMFAAAFVALLVAGPAMAADTSWSGFFGRTHVLWLHLPIGLLIGAFTIELFGFFKRSRGYDIAAAWLFVLGALSAIPAVWTGLLLGIEKAAQSADAGKAPETITQMLLADSIEQGVTETLGWHMWLGVALMVIAIVAAVLKILAVRKQWKTEGEDMIKGGFPLMGARVALIGTMLALPFAGHLGGNLVHGNKYLFEKAPFKDSVPQWAIDWPEESVEVVVNGESGDELKQGSVAFWNANIQPVLNKHCTACHYSGKQDGKLRLDTLEWAVKGGRAGSDNIVPEDPRYSELYIRVTLPHSNEEHMPTNKEKYGIMSPEDVLMLGEWIQAFDGSLKDPEPKQATNPKGPSTTKGPEPKPLIDPAALKAITDAGGNAKSLSLSQPELSIKLAYLKDLSPDTLANLSGAADKIAWITFEGSSLDDTSIAELPDLPTLTELNLKDTKITDAGLSNLASMPKLEWLNLFGTKITDASIEPLKKLTSLKKLYLTGTGVTAEGIKALREAMPETQIYSDHDGAFTFPDNVGKPVKPASEKEADKAAAKPVNTKCPVSGAPVKPGFVSTFQGKTVGFCCNNCKGAFDKEPAKFAAKIK